MKTCTLMQKLNLGILTCNKNLKVSLFPPSPLPPPPQTLCGGSCRALVSQKFRHCFMALSFSTLLFVFGIATPKRIKQHTSNKNIILHGTDWVNMLEDIKLAQLREVQWVWTFS